MDLVAYVDGGSLGNPGPAGVGVVIEGTVGERITIAKWVGKQDNNVAEYLALVEALQCALALNARKLHVFDPASGRNLTQMAAQASTAAPAAASAPGGAGAAGAAEADARAGEAPSTGDPASGPDSR